MYGVIDIANIESLEKAPPDIVSISPVTPLVAELISSANVKVSTPGIVI